MAEIEVPYTTRDGRRRLAPSSSVTSADHLIKFKQHAHEKAAKMKLTSDPIWDVLDEVIRVWKDLRPTEYKASIIDLEDTKDGLHDKEFGSVSKEKTKGTGSLRRTLDVPVFIELVLRRLYTIEELPFDKKWYEALWDKFPMFRVSEKR